MRNIVRFDKNMSAALIKQLASNPSEYVLLVQAGYKPGRMPGWVARPDPKAIAQLNQPPEKQVQKVSAVEFPK